MMPILAAPGVIIPGQLGPIRRDFFPAICAFTRIISITGIPSVMQTTSSTPASTASRMESAAPAAGTKIIETLQPVSRRARYHIRPVLHALTGVKSTGAAGDSLNDEASVFID